MRKSCHGNAATDWWSTFFPADELEKRRRLRQKKVREEKRRERRIEMEENKKQGKCKWSRTVCRFSPEALDRQTD